MKSLIALFLVFLIASSFVFMPVEKLEYIVQILHYILLIVKELTRK
jgi:hypothetical protein